MLDVSHGRKPEFYDIQIGRLADGKIAVAITATSCLGETDLCTQQLSADRTDTLDEVLSVIRREVRLD